ncbi:hypothetical protein H0H87_002748 [Tephrocybe sp. NHM501043]|nr:hypothetical protein H0H87_002748 [Tephrocybe sp. NHM501043]
MGYAPLGARTDRLDDVPRANLQGISCEEIHIPSSSPQSSTRITALLTRSSSLCFKPHIPTTNLEPELVVLYLQGNAGNPLHRLPVFQAFLSASPLSHTVIIAPAPRSYWKTPGRPSQCGILADYTSALDYALHRFPKAKVLLYGHSLGGAAAVCLLAEPDVKRTIGSNRIKGVILENPFASVPGMLRALYPQRWLPYQYLGGCVWDRWDALLALKRTSEERVEGNVLGRLRSRMLVITSELDEVVPPEMGAQIVSSALGGPTRSSTLKPPVEHYLNIHPGEERPALRQFEWDNQPQELRTKLVVIPSALHEDAWRKKGWAEAVGEYLRAVVKGNEGLGDKDA